MEVYLLAASVAANVVLGWYLRKSLIIIKKMFFELAHIHRVFEDAATKLGWRRKGAVCGCLSCMEKRHGKRESQQS